MMAPLVKTGEITEFINLLLAVPIGFLFGFALFHGGFTDSRKIASVFYFKDVDVPVVMFSAIVTAMLGLWGMSLIGFMDTELFYFLPTYLAPVMVGGLLFGVGMVVGGYCPGTAVASVATGKLDAMVFVGGFMIGSLLFGDLFPIWDGFYNSDYRGVFRLDQLFGMPLGATVLLMVVIAIAGSLTLRLLQRLIWPDSYTPPSAGVRKAQAVVVVLALLLGGSMAFYPTSDFLKGEAVESYYYIVPKAKLIDPGGQLQ